MGCMCICGALCAVFGCEVRGFVCMWYVCRAVTCMWEICAPLWYDYIWYVFVCIFVCGVMHVWCVCLCVMLGCVYSCLCVYVYNRGVGLCFCRYVRLSMYLWVFVCLYVCDVIMHIIYVLYMFICLCIHVMTLYPCV